MVLSIYLEIYMRVFDGLYDAHTDEKESLCAYYSFIMHLFSPALLASLLLWCKEAQ
jgi:membrane glycosyltransferase